MEKFHFENRYGFYGIRALDLNMPCVYVLHFGDFFYIGSTKKLHQRLRAHLSTYKKIARGEMTVVKMTNEKIYNLITSGCRSCKIKVYAYLSSMIDAKKLERFLISKHRDNDKCLNAQFPCDQA